MAARLTPACACAVFVLGSWSLHTLVHRWVGSCYSKRETNHKSNITVICAYCYKWYRYCIERPEAGQAERPKLKIEKNRNDIKRLSKVKLIQTISEELNQIANQLFTRKHCFKDF